MGKPRRWTIEELTAATKTSTSIRQILGKLGLRQAGGNYSLIKRVLKEYSISDTHLTGSAWSKGLKVTCNPGKSLEEILTRNSTYQSYKLKRRLFRANLKPQQCEECGWAQKTSSGRLPLELDHINGDRTDNRIENLRILCPNCHSLKPTHRGRNIRKQ